MIFLKNGQIYGEVKRMRLKRWEIALLASLLATLLVSAFPLRVQSGLADKLTRLHVLANSDSPGDQTLKLQVRDAVLAASEDEPVLNERLLQKLQRAAQTEVLRQGYRYPVTVTREHCYFDRRVYETFSLPAGYYDAVRVVIGAGEGKNWWCVIYPPLCAGMCERDWETVAREAGLTEKEISFICEEEGYVIRFQLVDWWGRLLHQLREK